jgi:DNA-binding transcriptional LysR family regulator
LAAAGAGITFVLADMQNLSVKGLVYRPLAGDLPTLKLAIAHRQSEDSPVVHQFLSLCRNLKSVTRHA